ncbi:MAG: hypothetical protein ACRDP1_00955 [Nocardioidaceae bacterium]
MPAQALTYTYYGQDNSSALKSTTTERGPPAARDHVTAYDAVDPWSHGASPRPDGTAPRGALAYNHPALLVQVASLVTTTQGSAWVASGDVASTVLTR